MREKERGVNDRCVLSSGLFGTRHKAKSGRFCFVLVHFGSLPPGFFVRPAQRQVAVMSDVPRGKAEPPQGDESNRFPDRNATLKLEKG